MHFLATGVAKLSKTTDYNGRLRFYLCNVQYIEALKKESKYVTTQVTQKPIIRNRSEPFTGWMHVFFFIILCKHTWVLCFSR